MYSIVPVTCILLVRAVWRSWSRAALRSESHTREGRMKGHMVQRTLPPPPRRPASAGAFSTAAAAAASGRLASTASAYARGPRQPPHGAVTGGRVSRDVFLSLPPKMPLPHGTNPPRGGWPVGKFDLETFNPSTPEGAHLLLPDLSGNRPPRTIRRSFVPCSNPHHASEGRSVSGCPPSRSYGSRPPPLLHALSPSCNEPRKRETRNVLNGISFLRWMSIAPRLCATLAEYSLFCCF